jgi:hypothetical protein
MSSYRIYFLDLSGRIAGAENHDCADDADAIATATTLLNDHPDIEIWHQTRVVAKLNRPVQTS